VWNQQDVDAKITLEANSRALVIGNRPPLKDPLSFPGAPLRDALAPEVGSNPQIDALTPDTSPAGVEFIRNTVLGATIRIPR
jgi:hypothetical protein